MNSPVLAYAIFLYPFVLEIYASYLGLGAVLSQQEQDGTVHPVAFANRGLKPTQRSVTCQTTVL